MAATKLFLENHLSVPIYVVLRVSAAVLAIDLYGTPMPEADLVEAGKGLGFPVEDAMRRCMRNGKLEYVVNNRIKTVPAIEFDGGRERKPEGPVLQILPVIH